MRRLQKVNPRADGREGPKSIAEYGIKISSEWRKSVEAIIETGNLLRAAQKDLKHGNFGRLFVDGLVPFSQDTAEKLMAIACNSRITNSAILRNLPPSWSTLYELSRLDEHEWIEAETQGLIRGDVLGREIKDFTKQRRRIGKGGAFLSALKKVRPAAIGKEDAGLEYVGRVLILGNQVMACNGDIFISTPIGFDSQLEFTTRADKLYELLSEISESDLDEFILEERSEKSYLTICSGTLRAWLLGRRDLEGELRWHLESLELNSILEKDWKEVPEGFRDGLKMCAFGASREKANTAYNSL